MVYSEWGGFTASEQLRQVPGGLSYTEEFIDLVSNNKPCKGFVNTIWPGNKIVKYSTSVPPLTE